MMSLAMDSGKPETERKGTETMTLQERIAQQKKEAEEMEAAELARIAAVERGEQPPEPKPQAEQPKPDEKPNTQPTAETQPPQPTQGQDDDVARLKSELETLRAERATWEQRYRTADGMLRKRESDRDAEIAELKAKIAEIASRPTEPPKPKEKAYLKHLTPEERQAIGEGEPLEIRGARGEIEATAEQLRQEFEARLKAQQEAARKQFNDDLVARQQTEQAEVARAKMFAAVEKLSPGFMADDRNPDSNWQTFLQMSDPNSVTGATYLDTAIALFKAGNAKGIAQMHADYMALNPSGNRAEKLESQVKPEITRASGKPPKPANEPVAHTLQEYDEFYKDIRRGTIKPNADGSPRTREQIRALQAELDDWYYKQQTGGA